MRLDLGDGRQRNSAAVVPTRCLSVRRSLARRKCRRRAAGGARGRRRARQAAQHVQICAGATIAKLTWRSSLRPPHPASRAHTPRSVRMRDAEARGREPGGPSLSRTPSASGCSSRRQSSRWYSVPRSVPGVYPGCSAAARCTARRSLRGASRTEAAQSHGAAHALLPCEPHACCMHAASCMYVASWLYVACMLHVCCMYVACMLHVCCMLHASCTLQRTLRFAASCTDPNRSIDAPTRTITPGRTGRNSPVYLRQNKCDARRAQPSRVVVTRHHEQRL